MKFRIFVLIFAFVASISGCTNKEKDESKVTAENIIQFIQAEVPEFISKGQVDYGAIGNLRPYKLSNAENERRPDDILIYIFDSEKAMRNESKSLSFDITGITALKTYEIKNAIVVHMYPWGNFEKYDEKIQVAMQKLNSNE